MFPQFPSFLSQMLHDTIGATERGQPENLLTNMCKPFTNIPAYHIKL
jgi:hypothetical protein